MVCFSTSGCRRVWVSKAQDPHHPLWQIERLPLSHTRMHYPWWRQHHTNLCFRWQRHCQGSWHYSWNPSQCHEVTIITDDEVEEHIPSNAVIAIPPMNGIIHASVDRVGSRCIHEYINIQIIGTLDRNPAMCAGWLGAVCHGKGLKNLIWANIAWNWVYRSSLKLWDKGRAMEYPSMSCTGRSMKEHILVSCLDWSFWLCRMAIMEAIPQMVGIGYPQSSYSDCS